jgi:hypothetical protein
MWRALIAALPVAQAFLMRRFGPPAAVRVNSNRKMIRIPVDAIAEIVTVARSRQFGFFSRLFWLGSGSHDVAASPSTFRLVMVYARKARAGA